MNTVTVNVSALFEHDGKSYEARGTWTPKQTWCAHDVGGTLTVTRVISSKSGYAMEPIEGGGLHRAASAALLRAARKDTR